MLFAATAPGSFATEVAGKETASGLDLRTPVAQQRCSEAAQIRALSGRGTGICE